MGLPLLRKKLFHPRRFLYPTAILWELWCVPSAPSLPHFACVRSLHLGFSFIHQQGEQRTLLSLELLAARFTVWDLSGIFSSFGSQVLWHLGHCAVIGAPKAKPAEMHFLIPSLGRFWWGNILRRNFQCFSKFLKQLLPHPTSGCRLSRHCPVTLWIFGFLQLLPRKGEPGAQTHKKASMHQLQGLLDSLCSSLARQKNKLLKRKRSVAVSWPKELS